VKVKLLFFAALREQLGRPAEELELPPSVTTVAALRAAVNQDMVPAEARIKAGDEVAFFPPVTGG
jgi:molybdopterin synthase sulfur carrier subunit